MRLRYPEVGAWGILVLLLAYSLTGCGASSHDTQPSNSSSPLHKGDCTEPDRSRCYPIDIIPSYCEVQAARQFFRDGILQVSQLPAWADRTIRDGAPLIVDFRHPDGQPTDRKADLLDGFLGQHHLRINQRDVYRCMDNTYNSDIARTQGGPYVPHGTA